MSDELEPIINQVSESVNHNSTRETVEAAFICLQTFVSDIFNTYGEVRKGLIMHGMCHLDIISEKMVDVGELLKAKGDPKDQGLKRKIEFYAGGGGDEFSEFSFPDVLSVVW